MLRPLKFAALRTPITAFLLLAYTASEASGSAISFDIDMAPNAPGQLTQKTDMLALKCFMEDAGVHYVSRVAVLDVPEQLGQKGYDIALVTGHGIDGQKDCIVQDFSGRNRVVTAFKKAPNYKAGTDTDWGLIYFKSFKSAHVTRYPLQSVDLDTYLYRQKPINFAKARGLPQNSQSCRLASIEVRTEKPNIKKNMITHDCRSIGGQSGTPVTTSINGADRLVGIHLGRIWMFQSPLTGRPNSLGYIRPFNDSMIAEISELLHQD